jgi:6-pyruvoyltetrahydropterin/6-carboxytetrahydropterin synthase
MGSQFVQPEIPEIEEKYTKEYFQKRRRNIRQELGVIEANHVVNGGTTDLVSNLLTRKHAVELLEAKHMTTISKKVNFASAHFLPEHPGKCRNLHGHEWTVEVAIEAPVTKSGMVMDFGTLKQILNTYVVEKLDHAFLNMLVVNPTAENLAMYIWNILQYEAELKLITYIRLWESPNSMVELIEKQMQYATRGMWDWEV